MASLPWFLIILSSFYLLVVLFKLIMGGLRDSSPKQQLPSPPRLPIIGNLHQLTSLTHRSLSVLSRKYGPLMLMHLGSVPVLIVSSVDIAREVLQENSIAFSNRPPSFSLETFLTGPNSISFLPYGGEWRQMRNACVSGLLNLKNVRSFESVRKREVAGMIENISHLCLQRLPVNLTKMIFPSFYNILSKCVTGRDSQDADAERFGELLLELQTEVLHKSFFFGDHFPWLKWIDNFSSGKTLQRFARDAHTYLDQLIDQHLVNKAKQDDADYREDFVDHLQKENNFSRKDIKSIIMEMFSASSTVTSIIEWTMSELIKNPNVMKKAHEEVRGVIGTKSEVDDADIQHMSYLKCILKETLRLYPVAPLVVRKSSADTCLSGYHVPAETTVMLNLWVTQRDVKYWDSPDEFIPERFYNNQIDFKGQHYELIPFGSGGRGCPGLLFVMAFVESVIANLLCRFDWQLPKEVKTIDMYENLGISLARKNPLLLFPVLHSSSSNQ